MPSAASTQVELGCSFVSTTSRQLGGGCLTMASSSLRSLATSPTAALACSSTYQETDGIYSDRRVPESGLPLIAWVRDARPVRSGLDGRAMVTLDDVVNCGRRGQAMRTS